MVGLYSSDCFERFRGVCSPVQMAWRVGCPVGSTCVRLCPYEFAGPEPLDILSAMAGHSDVNRDVVTRMGV